MKGKGGLANISAAADESNDEDNDDEIGGDSDDEEVKFGDALEGDVEEVGDSALSLFGPERFPSAAAFWSYAEAEHNFSLAKLRKEVGSDNWTDYHRMRLVNYLRKLGPSAAKNEIGNINQCSEFWGNDDFLQPVLGDDVLLFEDDEDWDDSRAEAETSGYQIGYSGEMGSASCDKDEEIARLRAELASARRLLSAFGAADDDCPGFNPQRQAPPSSETSTSSGAFVLVVVLRFNSEEKVTKLEEMFAPVAKYVRDSEPTTLSYSLLKSDKDPKQVLVFERYVDKEHAYQKIHRTSAPFLKFRDELTALNPVIDGHSYYEGGGDLGFIVRDVI